MLSLKKIITILFAIFVAHQGFSCTGVQQHILEELHKTKNGKAVFVVVIDSVSPNYSQGFKSYATVLEVYKGSVGKKVIINSGGFSSAGGQYLLLNEKYLVFADQKDEFYTAFVCDDLSSMIYRTDTKDDMEKEKNDLYTIVKQWHKLFNEKYTGKYEYKINGCNAATGEYKNGIADGQWLYYKKYDVRDYKLYAKVHYQNGAIDGDVHRWHSSFSFKEEESIYKNDELISKKLYARFPKKNVFYLASELVIETIAGQKLEHYTAFDTAFQTIKKYNNLYTGVNVESSFFSVSKVPHGAYYFYDESKKQKIEGQYAKGRRIGQWKTTTKDGKTINDETIPENKNLKDSLIVEHKKGSYFKGKIKNNQPIGTWVVKDMEKDYLASIPFENGAINGWVTEQSEKTTTKAFYKNGEKNGLSTTLNKVTKDTIHFAEYINGKRNGVEKYFHENGKLKSVANFSNGLQSGKELMYDEYGALLSIANYVDDLRHGTYEAYDSRFGLKDKGMYFHGLRVGKWIEKFGAEPVNYILVRTKKEQFYKSIPESYISQYESDADYEVMRNTK